MSDTTTPATEQAPNPAPAAQPQNPPVPNAPAATADGKPADEPLGEKGLAALQAERARVSALEAELKGLKPLREQFDALRDVFGDKADGAKPEDVVKGLQDQLSALQRENAVNALAREHGITDTADIARLNKITDPELRAEIAERLKPAPQAPVPPAPQTDPGQGARPESPSAEDAEYERFYPSTTRK